MTGIKAFVGHSFTPTDQTVVGEFLTILDEIAKLNPHFSWEHAQTAQPREISDKVMSLWSDKSLFIAICTKKEQVISEPDPKVSRGRRTQSRGKVWKTSDWIIQEIGFAIGRGCKLIVLIENGVREPGNLQGDLEYIKFERTAPSASFAKLLQTINNVVPQEKVPAPIQSVSAPQVEKDNVEEIKTSNWKTPSQSWELRDYQRAFHLATLNNDEQAADAITQSYLSTQAPSPNDKAAWTASCEWNKIVFGKNGSVQLLRGLTISYPESAQTFEFLAMSLDYFDQNQEAAKTFEIAAEKTCDLNKKVYLLGKAAVQYARAGKGEFTLNDILDKIKAISSGNLVDESEVLRVLRDFYNEIKNDSILIAIMERQVQLNPTDIKFRFDLAYKHSERGNDELSLYHYLKIPRDQRESSTWNNMGVAYDHLELKAHSVSCYRMAEELQDTLAMSNLANKFLIEGFIEEAKYLCDKALAVADFHGNVHTTLANANGYFEREDEKIDALTRSMLPIDRYYADLGHALIRKNPSQISGRWKGQECELDIKVDGFEFVATGSFVNPLVSGLAGALLYRGQLISPPSEEWNIEYKGIIRGYTVDGYVMRDRLEKDMQPRTLLGSLSNSIPVLLLLSEDEKEFHVMEKPRDQAAKLYKLKRLPGADERGHVDG